MPGPQYDGRGHQAYEGVTHESPSDILERAEAIPEASHEELAHALGRILAWQLEGRTLAAIGERVMVVAYKLRPDLIRGATIRQIASMRRVKKSFIHKLCTQFTRIFAVRGCNSHVYLRAKRGPSFRVGGGVTPESLGAVVNRFAEWRAYMDEHGGAISDNARARELMRRDLAPISQFLAELDARQ